jgi:hypothetical protein
VWPLLVARLSEHRVCRCPRHALRDRRVDALEEGSHRSRDRPGQPIRLGARLEDHCGDGAGGAESAIVRGYGRQGGRLGHAQARRLRMTCRSFTPTIVCDRDRRHGGHQAGNGPRDRPTRQSHSRMKRTGERRVALGTTPA